MPKALVLIVTAVSILFTGEPGGWYLSGQGTTRIDGNGQVTDVALHGRLVDLCPRLA